MKIKGLKL